ncbi:ABC-type antimicrobial peptide transport system, permease component [Parapedobacter luteus]|uniref:ABC-type antimicrobial peptide transport system, permease component n=1 Tax=Parapedobacter luteus TaxID=623280 RepID=A0A1T5EAQ2_9SPHI|nr:ABC transporter permease [Parapedobacter luteus]SKB81044.1 ABC-type antimicrobial peptide transport system, permease component [Parapedobacter luteus]
MIKNYLKTTLRHLWRNRLFTVLNVLGLAIGISACWIVYRMVDYELSFDKAHPDAERVYQIVGRFKADGQESGFGGVPLPLAPTLTEGISGVELVVPIYNQYIETLTVPAMEGLLEKKVEGPQVVATQSSYFDLVPHRWLAGSKLTALDAPDKVVLTESRATEYFPGLKPENIIGKTLMYDTVVRTITGVIADLDYPSSFEEKEFIAVPATEWTSDNWIGSNSDHIVFVKVVQGGSIRPIVDFATETRLEFAGEAQREYGFEAWFDAVPLTEKHFAAEYATGSRSASMNTLYGLMGISFFLLVLACINYVNLSTAQMPQRAREIGIRKTLGGTPRALIGNFLVETSAIAVVALLLAIPLTSLFMAVFPEFIPEGLGDFKNHTGLALFLLTLLAAITLAAGLYPAWLITKVQTVKVLKGQGEKMIVGARLNFRKALIVFQFVIAQAFIVSALIIGQQLNYTLDKDLGFTHDAVVNIPMPYRSDQGADIDPFIYKRTLTQRPEIAGIALGHEPLNNNHFGTDLRYTADTGEVRVNMPRKYIDADYLGLYQMELLAGTNIQQTDTLRDIVINDAARKAFGFKTPQAAIGQILTLQNKQYPIVGVIADFHQKDLHVQIEPIALVTSNRRSNLQTFHIKLPADRSQWKKAFAVMEQEWKTIYPNAPFDYRFNDERIKGLYESEYRMAKLVRLATGVTVLVSCLGLFGLATLTAFQRTKEIGIRKVLGATVTGIVGLLSKDFVKLVFIAIAIASPIAWWAMNKWLEDFAYRIDIQWWMFAVAGLAAVAIALLTVSWQAIRAAVANPVESLRDE